jgi:lysozyme
MKMSQEGINKLLKPFEGCKLVSYRCPAGIWTIGIGHTSAAGLPDVMAGLKITEDQANSILRADLVKFESYVNTMVKVPLSQNQYDVLVDVAYNIGPAALKNSTLLKRVNAKEFNKVPDELLKWTKGGGKTLPGLVRRRHAEIAWWNESLADDDQELRITPDIVPSKTMAKSKQGNAAIVSGALGALGAAKEIAAQAQEASDTADQFIGLAHNTNFLIMSAVVALGAAIWYWRNRNMEKNGV